MIEGILIGLGIYLGAGILAAAAVVPYYTVKLILVTLKDKLFR